MRRLHFHRPAGGDDPPRQRLRKAIRSCGQPPLLQSLTLSINEEIRSRAACDHIIPNENGIFVIKQANHVYRIHWPIHHKQVIGRRWSKI